MTTRVINSVVCLQNSPWLSGY